jgi:hypothetical protein
MDPSYTNVSNTAGMAEYLISLVDASGSSNGSSNSTRLAAARLCSHRSVCGCNAYVSGNEARCERCKSGQC